MNPPLLPNNQILNQHCPNYLTIFHPFNYLNEDQTLLPFYEKYDGFLCTIGNTDKTAHSFASKKRIFYKTSFYPSVQSIPYKKVPLRNLMTMIPVWSDRLHEEKFRLIYYLLSLTGNTAFYGVHPNQDIIAQGYMGKIPFDGQSVINILQEHGIVLIMHSAIHNAEGIPSSRIFEATAASTVVISDENPFVRKYFGDSVFYIDTTLSSQEVFQQIQDRLNTIFSDPEKALDMARRAHEIFANNFEMSKQLLRLQEMHNHVMQAKKRH